MGLTVFNGVKKKGLCRTAKIVHFPKYEKINMVKNIFHDT
jgi:hypothetical protein